MSARKSIVSILSLAILCIAAAWVIGVQDVWADDEPAEIVAYPVTGGNIYFIKQAGFVQELGDNCPDGKIYKCDKTVSEAIIPERIEGTEVKTIDWTFHGCDNLKNIELPDTIKEMEMGAFAECKNLKHIKLPQNLTVLSPLIFHMCTSLQEITLPDNMQSIAPYAFDECSSLASVKFPKHLISIEEGAFLQCDSLVSVNIPKGTKIIGMGAFFECKNLKKVNIPNSMVEIGPGAFQHCSKLKSITIPNSVVRIGRYAIDPSDESNPNGIPDFIIYGYSSTSAAAKYAKANGFTYINLNAPKKVSGLALKPSKKSLTASWKKSSGASGYEILYATNKNFKSSRKITTTGTKKTIKNLKSGKTYYVKVRSYKKADGEMHYSNYCTAKKVKIK